jgi:formylglycine-generating enzyme required for sulfatase activity
MLLQRLGMMCTPAANQRKGYRRHHNNARFLEYLHQMKSLRFLVLLSLIAAAPSLPEGGAPAAGQGKPYDEVIAGSTVKIAMVPIPGGEFKNAKGDVTPIKPLYMSKCEIPWDAYDIFCFQLDMSEKDKAAGVDAKSRPSRPYGDQTHGFGHNGYPAIHITRRAAEGFCDWLNKKTGKKYRIPTEAEWEYACRAGSSTIITPPELDKFAWYWDNSDDKAHPVGQKEPNGWGLHDMLGNVAEYVTVPTDPPDAKPVACGGSYDDKPEDVTPTARKRQNPDWNSTDPQNPKSKWWLSDGPFVGFRIVLEQ